MIEALQVVWIRPIQYFRGFIQQEDQLLASKEFLALHFSLIRPLYRLYLQCCKKQWVKIRECELCVEDASIQEQVDGFAVLENVGFGLGKVRKLIGYLGLVGFRKDECLRALHRVSYINKSIKQYLQLFQRQLNYSVNEG